MEAPTKLLLAGCALVASAVAQCHIDEEREKCTELAPACRELTEHLSEKDRWQLETYRNKILQQCEETIRECDDYWD